MIVDSGLVDTGVSVSMIARFRGGEMNYDLKRYKTLLESKGSYHISGSSQNRGAFLTLLLDLQKLK